MHKCRTRPGVEFRRSVLPLLRRALARALHAEGVTCARCAAALHPCEVPVQLTDEQLRADHWGPVHHPWLKWLDAAREALRVKGVPALCPYCRLLRRIEGRSPLEVPTGSVDVPAKRALYEELRGTDVTCATCGRKPPPGAPAHGFDMNHTVSKWEGGKKMYNLGDFIVAWNSTTKRARARNEEALRMPFEDAAPLMRREAGRCDVQCRSCHDDITERQRGGGPDWDTLRGWLRGRMHTIMVRL